MKTNYTTTISLTPQEVSEILKEHIERRTGLSIDKVELTVGTTSYGYGNNERDVVDFTGAKLTGNAIPLEKRLRADRLSSLASQIDSVEKDTTNGNK